MPILVVEEMNSGESLPLLRTAALAAYYRRCYCESNLCRLSISIPFYMMRYSYPCQKEYIRTVEILTLIHYLALVYLGTLDAGFSYTLFLFFFNGRQKADGVIP